MKWRKPSSELTDLLHETIPDEPNIDFKPMFGGPCYWVNGNMFAAVHQESIVVRLADDDRAAFLQQPGAGLFEPMPGRPMREYVAVTAETAADRAVLEGLLRKGYTYAASLPPKEKKPRKPRAKKAQ